MKERMTAYERREKMRLLLAKERSTSATFLMNHFGVSRRTVYNDLLFLNDVMPLVTHRGKGGGITLDLEYHAPKVYLSEDEENLLLRLLDSLCEKEKKMLINIINKFSMPSKK